MSKLTSRKFWMSVASLLAGIGTSIAGLTTENETLVLVGIICGAASTAIYTICESYVDATSAANSIMTIVDGDEDAEESEEK